MRKYCKDCKFHKLEMHPHPSGQYIKLHLCTHVECSDPVDASPIPCGTCRKEDILCSLKGKYYEQDKKEPEPTSNLVQLIKD